MSNEPIQIVKVGTGLSFNSETQTLSLGDKFHPTAPTINKVIVQGNKLTINWDGATSPQWFPITGYNVRIDGKLV